MALALVSACGGSSGDEGDSDDNALVVWVDAARLPAAEAYQKAHKDVKMDIVTYDGDGNGATTMQTKIQLWNRTGEGWPDVVFSQQVQDPVWMAQEPFEFAAPLEDLISEDVLSEWPETSRAQCTVDGKQVLRPGQPRPGGAVGQPEADGRVRLHRPDDLAGVGGAG